MAEESRESDKKKKIFFGENCEQRNKSSYNHLSRREGGNTRNWKEDVDINVQKNVQKSKRVL